MNVNSEVKPIVKARPAARITVALAFRGAAAAPEVYDMRQRHVDRESVESYVVAARVDAHAISAADLQTRPCEEAEPAVRGLGEQRRRRGQRSKSRSAVVRRQLSPPPPVQDEIFFTAHCGEQRSLSFEVAAAAATTAALARAHAFFPEYSNALETWVYLNRVWNRLIP